ncbi:hypothetical protein ACHAW6_008643 [Cyclotella cf. meneghiniana]
MHRFSPTPSIALFLLAVRPPFSSLAISTPRNSHRLNLPTVAMTQSPDHRDASTPDDDDDDDSITILGYGSLLSQTSALQTFSTLRNFRLARVPHHRRVFAHPASVFFRRNMAILETLEMSSLSAECEEGHSFVCSAFEVPRSEWGEGGIPSRAFLEREEEFDIVVVPYLEDDRKNRRRAEGDRVEEEKENEEYAGEKDGGVPSRMDTLVSSDASRLSCGGQQRRRQRMGVMCRRSTDEAYIERWGKSHFDEQYTKYGIDTIWNWKRDSGLKPCPVYLRHCVLASLRCGEECYESFLDETFLVDRRTTIREYLKSNPHIMDLQPPEELRERYGG